MNTIQIFNYENNKLRVIFKSPYDPWFYLKDVKRLLNYNDDVIPILSVGDVDEFCQAGKPKETLVNRNGVNSLMGFSRNKRFMDWLDKTIIANEPSSDSPNRRSLLGFNRLTGR